MCGPLRAQEKNQMLQNSLTSVRHKIRKWSVTWGFSSRGIQRISSNFGANQEILEKPQVTHWFSDLMPDWC